MSKAYDCHEALPEQIRNADAAKIHLCDLAYHRKKIRPEKCQTCGGCKYGLKLLELLGLECDKKPRELKVKDLAVQGKPLPTLSARLRKRFK